MDADGFGGGSGESRRPAEQLAFSVDTHLLKELGALLVGRDSTAIVELVKNAYDADAEVVTVHGEDLGSRGLITVTDDGHGMSEQDFREKFLRIAGRSKEGGDRRSPTYSRRFTGAKGIGRLSAHKLGAGLRLSSIPEARILDGLDFPKGFTAFIDWQAIEDSEQTINEARDITISSQSAPEGRQRSGTSLSITRLHGKWTSAQLNRFLAEVRSTRPDRTLVSAADQQIFPGNHLFEAMTIADTGATDPGFSIELSGDFAGSESQWPDLLRQMNWMIEIDATPTTVRYSIVPSARTAQENPGASPRTFADLRTRAERPEFTARIFVRDGSTTGSSLRGTLDTFAKDASGIRIYSEGFRVLPYGGPRNDWLGIDASYTQRSAIDVEESQLAKPSSVNERIYARPGSAYFGGVFLLDATSHGLEMVVNREGFLPNEAFEEVQRTVRKGIELSVRVRAAVAQVQADATAKEKRRQEDDLRQSILAEAAARDAAKGTDKGNGPSASELPQPEAMHPSVPSRADKLEQLMRVGAATASHLIRDGARNADDIQDDLRIISAALDEAQSVLDTAREEQAQLRVLASIGTQMGAFVHEVNGLLGQARTIRQLLERMLDEQSSSRGTLRQVLRAQDALISALERQAVYLADSLGAEARRRRTRQRVHDRVATAFRLLSPSAAARRVELTDDSDPAARTLPMFPAELNVVLTNLISNAIKAARAEEGDFGHVHITTRAEQGFVVVRVSNDGVAVDLADAERWFRPFESTTTEIDAALGQGLGLGLPLTRRIVDEYGGVVRFVPPDPGMSTSIDLALPTS